jgi:hypothetical protein
MDFVLKSWHYVQLSLSYRNPREWMTSVLYTVLHHPSGSNAYNLYTILRTEIISGVLCLGLTGRYSIGTCVLEVQPSYEPDGAYHFVPRVDFFGKDCPPFNTPREEHCNPRELVIILLFEMFTVVGLTQTYSQQGG